MIPLIVLLIAFFITAFIYKVTRKSYEGARSARIAIAIMLCFTAIGHFTFTEGMAMMVPEPVPFKKLMVYITGFIELCLAFFLFSGRYKVFTGWMLIAFFIVMLPANIKASLQHIDYKAASLKGPGVLYLWFRIPLQLLLIIWVYISCIRSNRRPSRYIAFAE